MKQHLLLVGAYIIIVLLFIRCNQDRGDCLVTKRFANGRSAAIACTNDREGTQTIYFFDKNGDTTGTYTYELIDNYYYPRKGEIYNENVLSILMVHDRFDTNKVMKYFYDTAHTINRKEYHINDTPFYHSRLTSDSMLGYSINYRFDISHVNNDSLVELAVQVPLPDSIISIHEPLYFVYGGTYLEYTVNWNDKYFEIFLDNEQYFDTLNISSSKIYNIKYPIDDADKTHLITALYSSKDKNVLNIKKTRLYNN